MKKKLSLLILAVLAGSPGMWASAQDGKADKQSELPVCVQGADEGFNDYVNLNRLGQAWRELDSEAIADAVLQLAEGERVLLRPHKAIDTDELAKVAVEVAADNGDAASLSRLARFAAARGNTQLSGRIKAAQKTSGTTRRISELKVDPGRLTTDDLDTYHALQMIARRAKIFGDVETLKDLEKELKEQDGINLPPLLRGELIQYAQVDSKLTSTVRSDSDPLKPTLTTLDKLSGVDRQLTDQEKVGVGLLVGGAALWAWNEERNRQTFGGGGGRVVSPGFGGGGGGRVISPGFGGGGGPGVGGGGGFNRPQYVFVGRRQARNGRYYDVYRSSSNGRFYYICGPNCDKWHPW